MSATGSSGEGIQAAALRSAGAQSWVLDVLLAITILGVLNAVAMSAFRTGLFKAKATESLLAASDHRAAVVEHFALTGEWLESDITYARRGDENAAAADPTEEMDRMMRGQQSHGAPGGGDESRRSSEYLRTTAGIVNGVVIVLGNYRGYDGISMLTLRPAAVTGSEQPTVQWLCGRSPTPPGWASPAVSEPTTLPDEFLYSICRNRRAR